MGWEISFLVVYGVIETVRIMQGASRARALCGRPHALVAAVITAVRIARSSLKQLRRQHIGVGEQLLSARCDDRPSPRRVLKTKRLLPVCLCHLQG